MEYLGFLSLSIIAFVWIYFSGYPGKVRKLEREVAKLKIKLNGGNEMSKLIDSLMGTKCKLAIDPPVETFDSTVTATILETDDEWAKLECIDKKEVKTIRLVRISDITNIKIID